MPHPADVSLSDLTFDLSPSRRGDVPLDLLVRSASARVSDAALAKAVSAALDKAQDKLPVEAELVSATFTAEGAEIAVKVGKGRVLSATITVHLAARGDGRGGVIVEISELRGLGLGLEAILGSFIDKVLDSAVRTGVRHDRKQGHQLLISPNELLASQGIPVAFDPKGKWDITASEGHVEARFAVDQARRATAARRTSEERRRSSSEEE